MQSLSDPRKPTGTIARDPSRRSCSGRVRQSTDATVAIGADEDADDFFTPEETPSAIEEGSVETLTNCSESSKGVVDESPEDEPADGTGLGCGRGIIADYKKTVGTHWVEEMTNFNQKTLAATFFLFFACITPAFTFGAIYAKVTHKWMGAVEMMIGTAWCGIIFALAGGQPMMINGGTGPVLAFSGVLYKMSESLDIPFLTFNAWTGLWVTVYMCVSAFVDLNRFIRYCTRFTDEIFALLISAIFIIDALGNPFTPVGIYYYFESTHKSHDKYENDPDYSHTASAILSLVLCLGTTALAFRLRSVKYSPFFCNQMTRDAITDFAVITSILVFTLVGNFLFPDVNTEKLDVPDTIAPTFQCCTAECRELFPDDCPDQTAPYGRRPWLVDLGDLNGKMWAPFVAAGPAFLAFILIFLDDGITKHLINHPCHKLQHGDAYNYDTVIIGLTIAINSIIGLPWLVAATVRSINHIHAMATKDRNGNFISVQETRLTGLGIHVLIAISLFILSLLQVIPVPVLYGVFLFMGLLSLGTNQFWGRFLMFFMQPSKYPKEPFTEHMMPHRMHLFTLIQLIMFVTLYVVKSIKVIAIAFPIVIAICIPIRLYILPRIFTVDELILIDSDEEAIDNWLTEHDITPRTTSVSKSDSAGEPFHDDDVEGGNNCAEAGKSIEMQKTHGNRRGRSSRVRQSTAATVAIAQDDDVAEFFGRSTGSAKKAPGVDSDGPHGDETLSVPESLPSLELVSDRADDVDSHEDGSMSSPESMPSLEEDL